MIRWQVIEKLVINNICHGKLLFKLSYYMRLILEIDITLHSIKNKHVVEEWNYFILQQLRMYHYNSISLGKINWVYYVIPIMKWQICMLFITVILLYKTYFFVGTYLYYDHKN